jgi:hypothetical protein
MQPNPEATPAEPAVDQPPHPTHALTTYELRDYRRRLEHAVKGIPADAPVQDLLRRKLDEVLAEQAERERIAERARTAAHA